MKTLLKISLIKAVFLLFASSAAATNINTQAFSYFTDPAGNTGFVYVDRATNPTTKVVTTTLSYSFCLQTTAATCQEGNGVIPNGAFTGILSGRFWVADVVKVLADTTIPGFVNTLCNQPDEFGCGQGTSPATGGLISLKFVTKINTIEQFKFNNWKLVNHVVTVDSTDLTSQGPASVQGTILGVNVNNTGASWGIEDVSGKGSPGAKAQTAKSKLALDQSLTPKALKRLQYMKAQKLQNR